MLKIVEALRAINTLKETKKTLKTREQLGNILKNTKRYILSIHDNTDETEGILNVCISYSLNLVR